MGVEAKVETWEYQGGTFADAGSWIQQVQRLELNKLEKELALYEKALVDFNSGKVNLVDSLEWVKEGYGLDSSGRDFAQSGYILSDYLNISYLQGKTIYIQILNNSYNNIAFYDATLKTINSTKNKGYSSYVVPDNAVYMRAVKDNSIGQDYMFVVSENFNFYNNTSLSGANYFGKKFDVGYRKDTSVFINGCGTGKISISNTDKLYILGIIESSINFLYTPLLSIFDKYDNEIAVFGYYGQSYKTGVLYEIDMSDYPEVSYFVGTYSFDANNSVNFFKKAHCFLFMDSDRQKNASLNNYINFVKGKNRHYTTGVYTFEKFIFSKTNSADGAIGNIEDFEINGFLYVIMKINGVISKNFNLFSFFGIDLNNVVPNETDFKIVIHYDLENIGTENNLISWKYKQMLIPNRPAEQANSWNGGENALVMQQLNGHFSIKNVRVLVVNKKYSNTNVYDSFIPLDNGIITDGARYSCGINSMFSNYTVCLFGDSIMESMWAQNVAQIVARHYNMKPLNLALSGSRPNARTPIDYNDTGWNLRDANLTNIPVDTRIVIIAGGTNNPSAILGSIDDKEARNTIYGCLNYAIDYVLDKIPECIVVLLGGIQKKGSTTLDNWNNGMKTLAEHRKDCLYADSGNALITDKTLPYLSYDGVHPMNGMSMRYAASALNALRQVVC